MSWDKYSEVLAKKREMPKTVLKADPMHSAMTKLVETTGNITCGFTRLWSLRTVRLTQPIADLGGNYKAMAELLIMNNPTAEHKEAVYDEMRRLVFQ